MLPVALRDILVPGSVVFLILSLIPGALLLFRKKDAGRAGKICITLLVVLYWVMSTPIAAVTLVTLATPHVPPIMSQPNAHGASAIVVLGAGMHVHRSRGGSYAAPTREGSLRVLEAARVYRVLGRVPIIATGAHGSRQHSEAGLMAQQLEQLGVPPGDIIKEEQSTNTRDHAIFVPAVLKQHGISQFVLVTSQQHIARSLAAFRAVGLDPVPSTPEVYVPRGEFLEMYVPSRTGLEATQSMAYDLLAWVYYKARGWI
ncbi:MAG TPA: YdcF family protein [Vicinamibacterales bacterium]|nr:YdcF family protein [Vicinamibacterales bacterium]